MNITNLRVRNLSGWTIFIFGVLALILGAMGLVRPEITLSILNFDVLERSERITGDYTVVFLTTSSMASFNVGIYYILASLMNIKAFYWWTVPFRILTFFVFTLLVINGHAPQGFIGVGIWELLGAILTGAALFYERKHNIE